MTPERRLAGRFGSAINDLASWSALGWLCGCTAIPHPAHDISTPPPTKLRDAPTSQPFEFGADYVAEVAGPVAGGVRRRGHALGMLDAAFDADLESLLGWRGGAARLRGLALHGSPLSASVGDLQATSNIEGPEGLRLFEAWIEQDLGGLPAALRVGILTLDEEFAVTPATLLFIHSSPATGAAFGNSGSFGPPIYPITGLAARIQVQMDHGWSFRAAATDGVPGDPSNPERSNVRLDDGDGVFVIGETERLWRDDETGILESKVALGVWGYPGSELELFEQPVAPGSPTNTQTGSLGGYLIGEHRLWAENSEDEQGVRAYAQLGLADGRVQAIDGYVGAGVTWTGPLDNRDADAVGIAVAAARISDRFQRAVLRPAMSTAADWEVALELTYAAQLSDWFTLQPHLQAVWNPGGDADTDDALVLGVRGTVSF